MNTNGKTSTTMITEETLYTPEEVGEFLGVSTAIAYFLIGREIPFILRNRCRLVRGKDLEEYATSPAGMALKPKKQRRAQKSGDLQQQPISLTDRILAERLKQTTYAGGDQTITLPPPKQEWFEKLEPWLQSPPTLLECYAPDIPAKNETSRPATPGEIVIVTRQPIITAWLRSHGITGVVLEHAYSGDVEGKHVIAHNLPFYLAVKAKTISWLLAPGIKLSTASVEDLDEAGASLKTVTWGEVATPPELQIK